jgi:Arc/MetJ-type ribon-helix-helix transcriptional regulator
MSALTQPLNTFIDEQIKSGAVSSPAEAEQVILSEVAGRALERKLAHAQEQVKNGQFYEANDSFVNNLLFEARNSITTAN